MSSDRPGKGKLGLNEAGPGVTVGDWQLGATLVTATDNRHDLAQLEEQAERAEQNERDAKLHGDRMPNPLGDLIHSLRTGPARPSASDSLMDQIRNQIERARGEGETQ